LQVPLPYEDDYTDGKEAQPQLKTLAVDDVGEEDDDEEQEEGRRRDEDDDDEQEGKDDDDREQKAKPRACHVPTPSTPSSAQVEP
jgi:hypothetical protein